MFVISFPPYRNFYIKPNTVKVSEGRFCKISRAKIGFIEYNNYFCLLDIRQKCIISPLKEFNIKTNIEVIGKSEEKKIDDKDMYRVWITANKY